MRTFTNATGSPVEVPYEDAEGVPGVLYLGPGASVQVDDADPVGGAIADAYALALTEEV